MEYDELELWNKVSNSLRTKIDKEVILPMYESYCVQKDFKMLSVMLSRYKFACKMLEGNAKSVLEIGCNSGFKTMMFSQIVDKVIGTDFDEEAIKCAKERFENDKVKFICADFFELDKVFEDGVDGIVSLDVIEHIPQEREDEFIKKIIMNLSLNGMAIIGTPNISASQYQSETSKIGHINMYSYDRLRDLLKKYFNYVFLFGMNDEIVHTGFYPMAHYLIAVGCSPKLKFEE